MSIMGQLFFKSCRFVIGDARKHLVLVLELLLNNSKQIIINFCIFCIISDSFCNLPQFVSKLKGPNYPILSLSLSLLHEQSTCIYNAKTKTLIFNKTSAHT